MERLLDDANELNEKQGIYTEYSLNSYADIVDAIHVVQTEMGITGTTAAEASSTIQGSLSSAKAAWKNLITGIADENQNLDKLVNNFVDSVDTAADNIIPRIEAALDGVGTLVEKMVPKLMERLPKLVNNSLPKLIKSGTTVFTSIIDGIKDSAPEILQGLINTASTFLTDALPNIVGAASDLLSTLIAEIPDVITGLLSSIPEAVSGIVNELVTMEAPLTGLAQELANSTAGVLSLSDAAAQLEPDLEYMSSLVNDNGETFDSLSGKVDGAADSITTVLSEALKKNGELTDADMEKIREYAKELDLLTQQENEFYARVQEIEYTKTGQEGISSLEEATQAYADAQAAYEAAVSSAEENYETELSSAIAVREAGDEETYNQMVEDAKATYDAATQAAEGWLSKSVEQIYELSKGWTDVDTSGFDAITQRMEQFNTDSENMLQENAGAWQDWYNGEIASVSAELSEMLGNLDIETANTLMQLASTLTENGGQVDEATAQMINSIFTAMESMPTEMETEARGLLTGLCAGLADPDGLLENAANQSLTELIGNMRTVLGVEGGVSKETKTTGKYMVAGLQQGIEENWPALESNWLSKVNDLVTKANAALGVESPSKVLARTGGFMAQGLGVGWDNEFGDVEKQITADLSRVAQSDSTMAAYTSSMVGGIVNGISSLSAAQNGGTYNINLVCDGEAIAKVTFDPLKDYAKANGTPIVAV